MHKFYNWSLFKSLRWVQCYWGVTPTAHKAYITIGSFFFHSDHLPVYSSHHRARHLPALRDFIARTSSIHRSQKLILTPWPHHPLDRPIHRAQLARVWGNWSLRGISRLSTWNRHQIVAGHLRIPSSVDWSENSWGVYHKLLFFI